MSRDELRHRITILRVTIKQASARAEYTRMYAMCSEHDTLMLKLLRREYENPARLAA